jgi:hypothetical protein
LKVSIQGSTTSRPMLDPCLTQTPYLYPPPYTCVRVAAHGLWWRESRTSSLCLSNALVAPGRSCATAPTRCASRDTEEMTELQPRGRGRGCTDANPQQAQFHSLDAAREGRECVQHDDGSARCQGTEQEDGQRDVTANPEWLPFNTLSHTGLSLIRSFRPGSAQAVTSLFKHFGASSSYFSLAVNISL